MVLEHEIVPFDSWLASHIGPFGWLLLIGAIAGLIAGYLIATLRHGPFQAARTTGRTLVMGLREVLEVSPRRVGAMARLAAKEAIRRKVLVVFLVFALLLLFGGWYLDRDSEHPGRLYISFVVSSTHLLILLLAIFLSAFSLPNDIRDRTVPRLGDCAGPRARVHAGRYGASCGHGDRQLRFRRPWLGT